MMMLLLLSPLNVATHKFQSPAIDIIIIIITMAMNYNDIQNFSRMLDKNADFKIPEGQTTGFSLQEDGKPAASSAFSLSAGQGGTAGGISLPATVIDQQLNLPIPSQGTQAKQKRRLAEKREQKPAGNAIWSQVELQALQRVDVAAPNTAAGTSGSQGMQANLPRTAPAGVEEPTHSVLYQHNLSAEDVYLGVDFTRDSSTASSDGVVVKVELPKVGALSEISMEVEAYCLYLHTKDYYLSAALPRKVVAGEADAKWDANTKILVVRLKADSTNDVKVMMNPRSSLAAKRDDGGLPTTQRSSPLSVPFAEQIDAFVGGTISLQALTQRLETLEAQVSSFDEKVLNLTRLLKLSQALQVDQVAALRKQNEDLSLRLQRQEQFSAQCMRESEELREAFSQQREAMMETVRQRVNDDLDARIAQVVRDMAAHHATRDDGIASKLDEFDKRQEHAQTVCIKELEATRQWIRKNMQRLKQHVDTEFSSTNESLMGFTQRLDQVECKADIEYKQLRQQLQSKIHESERLSKLMDKELQNVSHIAQQHEVLRLPNQIPTMGNP